MVIPENQILRKPLEQLYFFPLAVLHMCKKGTGWLTRVRVINPNRFIMKATYSNSPKQPLLIKVAYIFHQFVALVKGWAMHLWMMSFHFEIPTLCCSPSCILFCQQGNSSHQINAIWSLLSHSSYPGPHVYCMCNSLQPIYLPSYDQFIWGVL